ncbi:MAG: leucine-rich repeat protein [Bacteroidaceae bacterium]|nr:leucine-rich repeat protein [Bacteroidaceae bacterium]
MKKFLLTLIVTMLTCVGAWADGVVTLSPAPSGTLELNLTDDAGGKIIGVSSPAVAASQGNSQFSFVCYDENDDILSSQDIVECTPSFVWSAEGHTVKIIPRNVGVVKLQFVIKNPYSGDVDKSEIITVSVNDEQKIPATLSGVPASIRVGNSGTAVVNVDGFAAGDDYTVVFSSTDESVIKVDAATGVLTPVAAGNATIKALVTPTTTGSAASYVAKTLEANVEVKAEITATWNGSIANTSIPLGVQTTQSSDYPQAIWSESITGATTVYSVISDDETVVKGHFTLQDNKPNGFVLAGIKAGTTNVSIKAEYGMWEYPGGVATWNPITEKISDPVEVTVTPIDVKLTVSPSTDLTMDVTLTDGETRDLTTTVVDGFGVTKSASVTAGDDVVDLSISQDETQLTIKPKAGAGVGTATVTVKAVWVKALEHPYVEKGTEEREVSFNVTVDDQTLVKTIDNPGTQDVQQGKTTVIPVAFTPTTAQFQAPTVSGNDKITVAYANGGTDYTNLEVTVADDAEIGSTATVTLTPKAGSYVTDPVTFTVKVTKKELPVTDVKPQDVIHVGELCENMLGINESYGLEKDVDYTVSYVATGTNKNGQPLVSFDSNGDIHGLHVGTAHITVTFAPIETSPKVSNYKAWTREMDITVVPGETKLNLAVPTTVFEQGVGGTTTLNYDFAADGYVGIPCMDFTLGFDVEGTATGVTLGTADENLKKWDIIVGTDAPAEQFALVVTLVPNNPEDYNTATAKVGILVKNSSAQVTISVDENGVYTVNVPSPGAFGAISADPVEGGNAELVGDATLQGLKDAASVKVTGLIANSDVRELVHLIGESSSSDWTTAKVCTSLDMSGAQMTEEITSHDAGDNAPSNSWVDDGDYWSSRLFKLEYLSLPKPSPSYTTLPSNMYALYLLNPVSLNTLIIPEGWTEIKEQAFSDKAGNPTKALTKLELPNSVEKIGAYAFSNLMVKVLNMPENIQRIDEYAFAPCSKLEDVYFYGPAPSFVHTFAFGGDSQMCNNTVNDVLYNDRYEPETTRFNYQVAGVLACLLHYPKEYQKDYIDMTRVYETCPVDQLYHKGNAENTYHVPGWTAAVINSILNHPDHNGIAQVHDRVDFGVKDKYYGYNMVWPSQSQMTMGFALSQAGYTWEGNALRTADQYNPSATYENGLVDKRGLYQFMTTMGNSTIHFTYEQDEWYTISLPFNMTPAEIQRIFGPQTQVCRFSKVVRETNEEAKEIRLEFRNSVMGDALTAGTGYVGTHYDEYGDWDAKGNWVVEPAFDQSGIVHHYPYMIKPSGTVNEDPAIKIEGSKRIFNGRGFDRISGTLHDDAIVPVKADDSQWDFTYAFCPILEEGTIKPYSYVLVNNGPKKHEYAFYKGVKQGDTYVAGGKANQNTAYIQLPYTAEMVDGQDEPEIIDRGYEDFLYFFTTTKNYAPVNASIFGDDEVTGIEKVVIVCGTDKVADNKVYTINGQLVNNSVLAPGLYIKNGKKFIVK